MTTITISRHYGSGGRKVAARVREILDYRFFDSAFLTQIASQVGLSKTEIADFSEEDYKVKNFLERLMAFNPADMVVSPSAGKSVGRDASRFDDADSIELGKVTVRVAHEQGNVVIVGRGAQVLLRNQPDVLHVRVIAPLETRLKRLQDVEGLTLQEAKEQIEARDKAVRQYIERYFGANWDDPYLYHLTINTGYCDIEQAAQLVVAAARQLVATKAV
jgi:cytidylate kinase